MRVDEVLSYNSYWEGSNYKDKRPNLRSSRKRAFGDNIYHTDNDGTWRQEASHHSYADGTPNYRNVDTDTSVDRVLVGHTFWYWGASGPPIPPSFRNYKGYDIQAKRGHKCRFPSGLLEAVVQWVRAHYSDGGYLAEPRDWLRSN